MSFVPQCVLQNIMMTSLLADKLFIVKIEKLLNFMNEIINPPCNSLLATIFELSSKVYLKRASSCLRKLVRPKLLFLFPPLLSRRKNCCRERGEESPVGIPEGPTEVGGVCEREAGTRQMLRKKIKTLMLLVSFTRLGSLGTSLEDSRSQKSFVERDWRRRMCPRVSLTPLTFHNVSFQIFINYH